METLNEVMLEYPTTTVSYARVTVRLDLPGRPYTLTQAMMISDSEIDKLKREWEVREYLDTAADDAAIPIAMNDFHKAQDEARMVRQIIANKIAIALSDAFRP